MMHDENDKAREMFTRTQLDGNLPIDDSRDLLDEEPYVVIGDFAYILGYDGSVYMAPIKSDIVTFRGGGCVAAFFPDWRYTVRIPDDADKSDLVDSTPFPRNRLGNVIADIGNIRDIMRQMGIKVETRKIFNPAPAPKRDKVALPPQVRCNCESSTCEGIHPMGGCTVATGVESPKMLYLGEVCVLCATRIEKAGGGQYITWPHETDKQP